VRVIRLARHGASLPIGIGVSCSADRQIKAKITPEGILPRTARARPGAIPAGAHEDILGGEVVKIDLDRPMSEIRAELSKHPVKTRVSLTGTMVVARDIAHAKLPGTPRPRRGPAAIHQGPPGLLRRPGQTPAGYATGSFGRPRRRMDSYVEAFQAAGGSMVMLAKGNRSKAVRNACQKHGGFYLGSVGGPAARLAQDCIRKVEVLEYPELGMEAVWRIEVEDFPAFIVVDDKGNDFYEGLE